jgi:hypothetical protein
MPEIEKPFGVAELCFRGRNACPVRGCVEASPCRTHHIGVHPTRPIGGFTYVYDDPWLNLLWADDEDRARLKAILRGKRESRMGHEHSEDAVTWNVFRFFERNDCITPAIRTICPCPESEPLAVFWTTHEERLWEPFRWCSDQIPERKTARSESDLIFLWEKKLVVVVEAKFRSPNRSDLSKRRDELRKAKSYIEHASRYINVERANEAVLDGWYELLRNWVLGIELKDTLCCEDFVLVNLLRRRHETEHREDPTRDFAEHACVLTPNSRFVVAYWEDLIAAAPSICDHADSGLLIRWARNKSELLGKPAFDF